MNDGADAAGRQTRRQLFATALGGAVRNCPSFGQGNAASGHLLYVGNEPRCSDASSPTAAAVVAEEAIGALRSAGGRASCPRLMVLEPYRMDARVDVREDRWHALLLRRLLATGCVVRWRAMEMPKEAERWLCEALRQQMADLFVVLDVDALVLVSRAHARPIVPDVVRLSRRHRTPIVGVGSMVGLAHRVPAPHAFRSWAEKARIQPVFCG